MTLIRTKMAFLLSPIFPAIFFIIAFKSTHINTILLTLLFAIPFSYISCIIFGMTLLSYFRKKECLNAINISLSGAVLGALVFYIFGFAFAAFLGSSKDMIPTLSELIGGALLGLLVAIPFCIIAGIPLKGTQTII